MITQKHFMDHSSYTNRGYITLLSVMVVGAVALALSSAAILSGITSTKVNISSQQSSVANTMASTCAYEALERIRTDTSYTGSGSVTQPDSSCYYEIIDLGSGNREVRSTGTAENISKKIRVTITLVGTTINLSGWNDVATF